MANKKKKKNKAKSHVTSTRRVRHQTEETNGVAKLITTIIAISFAIFVFISVFSLGGSVGSIVKSIVLSLFGTLGYTFPIIIVLAIIISLFYSTRKSNIKINLLLLIYLMLICIIECNIHHDYAEMDFIELVNENITRARNYFGFTSELYSAGAIGITLSYISNKAIGRVGALILFSTILVVSLLSLFGSKLYFIFINILKGILFFIPNLIKLSKEKREEDRQIAIDNENILKNTIEKSKMKNLQATFDNSFSSSRIVLEPITEKKRTFDTKNLTITANDIQSRFYDADNNRSFTDNNERPQNHLLKEMKKKSINEILYEEKEKGITNSEFFYTDKIKPISELTHINIPEPNLSGFVDNVDVNNEDIINENGELKNYNVKEIKNEYENNEDSIYSNDDYSNISKNIKEQTNDTTIHKSRKKKYKFPPLSFLHKGNNKQNTKDPMLEEKANLLVETLKQFGVGTTLLNITVGPAVTRYELKPDAGVKVSKILSLENDVQLALAASSLKIEAPIPGKAAIGIEIANEKSSGVLLGDIIATSEFKNATSKLTVAIGKDISGKAIITDLRKMPHLLIAGATGSGKSVCVNSLITSLIYKSSPEDVRLIMVDPKVVEPSNL